MRRQSVIRRTEIIANIIPICDSPNQCDAIPPFQFMFFFFFYIKSAIPFNCAAHPRKITSTFCDIPTAFHFSLTVHNIHSYYIQTLRVIHIYYSHCVELCRLYYIIIPILEMESSGLQFGSWCDKIILNVQAKL